MSEDDNVTPITPSHVCASCKREVKHELRFYPSAHGPDCKQPENRLRRAELEIVELRASLLALARHLLSPRVCLNPDECGGCDLCPNCSHGGGFHGTCGINEDLVRLISEARKETHGISEASPDTQRSGSALPVLEPGDGLSERSIEAVWYGPFARDPERAYPDARPAEPERPQAAGAVPAREEPGQP
jgi:hypothetical protein